MARVSTRRPPIALIVKGEPCGEPFDERIDDVDGYAVVDSEGEF